MTKHFLTIFFTVLSTVGLKAQVLDQSKLECEYRFTWIQDTTKRDLKKEDFMILKVGDKVSEFYSFYTFRVDSAIQADKNNGASAAEMLGKVGSYGKKGASYHIFTNFPSGKITVTDKVGLDNFKYEEPIVQNWKIQTDKATINSYAAQKAVCTFSGRQYTAWFTTEIPMAIGPWKFSGLPGLILKVEDTRGDFKFEMIGLRQLKNGLPIQIGEKAYIATSKEKFQKLLSKFYQDPISYLNANSGVKITPVDGTRKRSRPYNPIEL